MTRELEAPNPYWEEPVGLGLFYFGHAHRPLAIQSHHEPELFRVAGSAELLRASPGTREYLASRLLIPGTAETRPLRLADGQAWYYPADHTIVLWELIPEPQVAVADPRESLLYRTLWMRYERYLAQRFASGQLLVTTWEDMFDQDQWMGFLNSLGYEQRDSSVFAKHITRTHLPS
jgi:hypothetical protein